MECQAYTDLTQLEINANDIRAAERYRTDAPVGTMRLSLSNLPEGGDQVLSIFSGKASAVVFQGPVADEVTLSFGSDLAADKGWDNLSFSIIDTSELKICGAINDLDQQVWIDGRSFAISFHEIPIWSEDQLAEWFRIEETTPENDPK